MDINATPIPFFAIVSQIFPYEKTEIFPSVNFFVAGILLAKGVKNMGVKGWAITAGLSAAAGAIAVLMMPHNNPTRKLAAKAANKMEDVAWKIEDRMNNMDM